MYGQLGKRPLGATGIVALFAALCFLAPAQGSAEVAVGTAEVVVKDVTGHLGTENRKIVVSDSVHHNETIETALKSATEVEFIDKSRLSIGPGSVITLDSFVFDPGTDSGRIGINAVLGVFRFASSKTKKIAYDIRTPLATVGIRGTRFTLTVDGDGSTSVITEEDGLVVLADCSGHTRRIEQCGRSLVVRLADGDSCAISNLEGAQSQAALNRVAMMDATLGLSPASQCAR
jgi:hypothetical protein